MTGEGPVDVSDTDLGGVGPLGPQDVQYLMWRLLTTTRMDGDGGTWNMA